MLALRALVCHLSFVLLRVHLNIADKDCKTTFTHILTKQGLGKPCVYLDLHSNTRFIGWRFNLSEEGRARGAFKLLGEDYETFYRSPSTPVNANCKCTEVPCLNERQVDKLLDFNVERTLENIGTLFPSFKTLCCRLRARILGLVFAFGRKIYSDFATVDIEYYIKTQRWRALARELNQTEWCRDSEASCAEHVATIAEGCDVRRMRRKRGIGVQSKRNITCVSPTCRKGENGILALTMFVLATYCLSTSNYSHCKQDHSSG